MNRIDHIVINTRDRTDEAVAFFQRMGFIVTARGHHTLGSINHTIMFQTDYLELLGYPPGKPPEKRPELVQRPAGLMATVLNADDADKVRATLIARGMAPRPVSDFSRPVDLDDGTHGDAAFRVTRLEPDAIPGSWFYYCQQLTPQFVWRPEWQAHPNGCMAMTRVTIEVADPAAAAPVYVRAVDDAVVTEIDNGGRLVKLPSFEIRLQSAGVRMPGMRTLVLGTRSLQQTQQALVQGGIAHHKDGARIVVESGVEIGCGLEFEPMAQS